MSALTPEEFVTVLYRCCLGREPDPDGLASWSGQMRLHGDPTAVLAGIMASEEFRLKSAGDRGIETRCAAIADGAHRALRRPLRIVDVGAQLLGAGSNPYDPLVFHPPVEIIGFDPLEERLVERAEVEGQQGIKLLPYAIGDGDRHTLYINNDDATSSLYPLNTTFNASFNHLRELHTVDTQAVDTRRLDDVLPPGAVDFLKLDVQGGELMVLKSARRTLGGTAVVHCEVEFAPIYAGQPLYPEIQQFLNEYGFELIDLLIPGRYHYVAHDSGTAQDRLLWADAVFFRVTDDPDTLRAQSLIAAAVYRKPTLAARLLSASG
ncbi:FkbM family methyltransferase [Mesorhizobium sp. B3-1-9]|uniref:FkbM family methyltransferase n=1 Tax=unclassified Mesorhizobium TaxID=325217 RepID=UPI0011281D1B|nr:MULTISPECIES: FkbM family methyltransferase [unclassified Mesorhizobium]TPI38557.1 FkbM family methyltransferase [Mesorhizobium sp. B3-1-9]TPI61341.1 FkbM family methyltransferase [Mesorhizobium sp. B3-1-7]